MTLPKSLKVLAAGATIAALSTNAAFAAMASLPPCKTGGGPVSIVIETDTASGWTVNGVPAIAVSNVAWANAGSAKWIGLSGAQPGTLTYVVRFSAPMLHGPMKVTARWATDNCGTSLRAGTGTPVPTGPCYSAGSPNGRDFMYFNHSTTASFSPADNNDPNPSITFVTANQPGSPAGMAGTFVVTAECRCP
ncbi:MAG: hypothetical protein WDN08_15895 [Rhizomicrobium sp.]